MYCPACHTPHPDDAGQCPQCGRGTAHCREHVFVGSQFVLAQASADLPLALKVDGQMQVYHAPALLSRHEHVLGLGSEVAAGEIARMEAPRLDLFTVITDRKIYPPRGEAGIFVVAPWAGGQTVELKVELAGQAVYQAQVALNPDGLALHRYADFAEGEYAVTANLPGRSARCEFSAAEYSLSPLVATLEAHTYAERHLRFRLQVQLLSRPYSGKVELGLQCKVCGERVVATHKVQAEAGRVEDDFDLSRHGGPFHVQITTPEGHTALVAFPGTGARERERIPVNPLGQTVEAGLLPWEGAQPLRGLYLGAGEMELTPLMLESVRAEPQAQLSAAADIALLQVVVFDPRTGERRSLPPGPLGRGERLAFDVPAPYALFTVGAFVSQPEGGLAPFEGWGVVFRPPALAAKLEAPAEARPGETIDVQLSLDSPAAARAYCLLLAYDARLEHESPLPRLARQIYDHLQAATRGLAADKPPSRAEIMNRYTSVGEATIGEWFMGRGVPPPAAMPASKGGAPMLMRAVAPAAGLLLQKAVALAEAPAVAVAPMRMDFPEVVHLELFYVEGQAARTLRLGDQIGLWRVRAYLFAGVDSLELTADVQADKPLYAEVDAPAIASPGDDLEAAVHYHTRGPAELVIATVEGETRARVDGDGQIAFRLRGPGRVEARLENASGADWSVRDVARPGVQTVTASRLALLDRGQSVQGERLAVYASIGQVLQETITALIDYPFG